LLDGRQLEALEFQTGDFLATEQDSADDTVFLCDEEAMLPRPLIGLTLL
jgi:hypothetical protein